MNISLWNQTLSLAAIAALSYAISSHADESSNPRSIQAPHLRELIAPPKEFVDACHRYPWLCENNTDTQRFIYDDQLLSTARRINNYVNKSITYISDPENHGVIDYWTLPSRGGGDCEDFVLLKIKLLLEAGINSKYFSIAIAQNQMDENHAVLILHHGSGDLVLDSMTENIVTWNEAPYWFLAVQTRNNKEIFEVVAHRSKSHNVLAKR